MPLSLFSILPRGATRSTSDSGFRDDFIDVRVASGAKRVVFGGDVLISLAQLFDIHARVFDHSHIDKSRLDSGAPQPDVLQRRNDSRKEELAILSHELGLIDKRHTGLGAQAQ